jgi:hypothetical protein
MSARRATLVTVVVGALALAAFQWIFGGFFPSENERIGHDYGYFLPQLLNGFFWYEQNGLGAIPWFTPALGAGVPFYPNPANIYYSVPQFLAFVVDPLTAVRMTLVLFAAIGYAGMVTLLRRTFGLGLPAALFGAVAFAFNGFYAHRMLIGHFAFHSFMLAPWIAHVVLRPLPEAGRGRRALLDVLVAGALLAYMFQSAYFYGIPVVVLVVVALALILAIRSGWTWSWILRLGGGGVMALLLCCSKLAAGVAFVSSFPRSGYGLPGVKSIGAGLAVLSQSLFWFAPENAGKEALAWPEGAIEWNLPVHSFEFGVTPVTALLLVVGLALWVTRGGVAWVRQSWKIALLSLVLVALFAINVYQPDWNAFLKTVPLLKSSSNLLRYFATYIPILIVLAALGLESAPARLRGPLAALAAIGVVVFNAVDDRTYYANQNYPPASVVASWDKVNTSGEVPPVVNIEVPMDAQGNPIPAPINRNDVLIRGGSQLICYEPIFGYQQEWFPWKNHIAPGPAGNRMPGGGLNTHNPSFFVFPAENGGEAGEPFRVDQMEDMRAFLSYRPFPFEKSTRQVWLDRLNVAALVGLLLGLVFAAVPLRRQRA